MPPDTDKQSKTERASSYKLRRSREQGQVAKSQDLSATVTFIVTFVMIAIYSPWEAIRIVNKVATMNSGRRMMFQKYST